MRAAVRPQGDLPGRIAVMSPVPKRIIGYSRLNEVTTISPTSPGGTGSPVPADDLDQHAFVEQHALYRAIGPRALVGDHAEVGGTVVLEDGDAAVGVLLAQAREQRAAADQGLLDRGDGPAGLGRLVHQDFEVVGHAAVADRPDVGEAFDLLLGLAAAGRHHAAADIAEARVRQPAAGRQVIRKGVPDDVALAEAGGIGRAGAAPEVAAAALRFEDRAGRHEDAADGAVLLDGEAAERRAGCLQALQVGLAQHRQLGERLAAVDGAGLDAGQWRAQPGARDTARWIRSGSSESWEASRTSGSRTSRLS